MAGRSTLKTLQRLLKWPAPGKLGAGNVSAPLRGTISVSNCNRDCWLSVQLFTNDIFAADLMVLPVCAGSELSQHERENCRPIVRAMDHSVPHRGGHFFGTLVDKSVHLLRDRVGDVFVVGVIVRNVG